VRRPPQARAETISHVYPDAVVRSSWSRALCPRAEQLAAVVVDHHDICKTRPPDELSQLLVLIEETATRHGSGATGVPHNSGEVV